MFEKNFMDQFNIINFFSHFTFIHIIQNVSIILVKFELNIDFFYLPITNIILLY